MRQALIESPATQAVRDLHALGSHCGSCGITIDEHTGWVWCDECGGISCQRCRSRRCCTIELKEEIESLEIENDRLHGEVADLEMDVCALKEEVSDLKDQLAECDC